MAFSNSTCHNFIKIIENEQRKKILDDKINKNDNLQILLWQFGVDILQN